MASPLPLDAEHTVFYPHSRLADFVVHFSDTAFIVHKLVLHHHSAYFRAYLDTLLPLPRGGSASSKRRRRKKRAKAQALPAADAERCNHPHIAHCIHLPPQTTPVEQRAVTAADFELFLRHLYFSAHYCCPPFLPKTDIDLDADCPALSLTFTPVASLDWSASTPLRITGAANTTYVFKDSLLALAHYLDCAQLTAQCEAVLLSQAGWAKQHKQSVWLAENGLVWLLMADRYKMHKWKAACIRAIAAEAKRVVDTEKWKNAKQQWDKALSMEVLEAAIRSK